MINIFDVTQSTGIEIKEVISYPAKNARFSNIPDDLELNIKERLGALYPEGLYFHQAKAINAGLQKKNVCVATPTASGKTVIFTSIAISHLLKTQKSGAVLALYPAKALLHDQEKKWKEAVSGMDIKVIIIDGGTEVSKRFDLLKDSQILLMTPDVLHAWVLSKTDNIEIQKFLAALSIVIIDEAHYYDGVFGTNMAYLLHRLRAVSGVNQFLASSATIGNPIAFLKLLTGLEFELISSNDDGSSASEKSIMLCRMPLRTSPKFCKNLIREYSLGEHGPFLIFVDSRKRAEEEARRLNNESHKLLRALLHEHIDDDATEKELDPRVLPYRAGYEEDDREAIQNAITNGKLLGVVTTSALELGIDIGNIELVIMLGTPPSIKSFWQRAGRIRKKGNVLLIDLDGRITSSGLQQYLEREPEPNWLYLDNEYLQYVNALCAAEEQQQSPKLLYSKKPLSTLPSIFIELLNNEINPSRPISTELYPLKQQAIANSSAHHAFPLRSGIEKTYKVICPQIPNKRLGTLSYSQVLREAFPGAIYSYLTKPYRVFELKHTKGEISTAKSKNGHTSPIVQTAVFPRFADQLYYIHKSSDEFIAECRLQVSERVIGFTERIGQNTTEILYGIGSPYSQRPLIRYIDTTGVCFYFTDGQLQGESIGKYIGLAFCKICSVQERDIGWGTFISQASPLEAGPIRGFSIYDSTYGSLRLTKQITLYLNEILDEAERIATEEGARKIAANINKIKMQIATFGQTQQNIVNPDFFGLTSETDWVTVIAPNQKAILHDGQARINEEVEVLDYAYTRQGIMYRLQSSHNNVEWRVSTNVIQPIHGVTKFEKYNLDTGEKKPL